MRVVPLEVHFTKQKRIRKMAEEVKAGRQDLVAAATTEELGQMVAILQKQQSKDKAAVRKADRESDLRSQLESGANPRQEAVIVENVLAAPTLVHWKAVLDGGVLATSENTGPVLAFKAAPATQRVIWMTESFIRNNLEVGRLVAAVCASRGSKWALAKDAQHFVSRAQKSRSQAVLLLEDDETVLLILPDHGDDIAAQSSRRIHTLARRP